MNLWRLVSKEIRFRKAGFAMGLASVAVAITCMAGAVTLLRAHDLRTEQILAQRERETREAMERMDDDYRLIMRRLGHNVMILHEQQSLAALRAAGHPDTFMPEEYVHRLARGGVDTLNHLLPVLQQRVKWPEKGLEVILSGTPGQVPIVHKVQFLTPDGTAYRDPIMAAVPPGVMLVGQGVARDLGLREGDTVTLMGEKMKVGRVFPPEGTQEDLTVWVGLDRAQEWLGRKGQINGILALECICEPEGLGRIVEEVRGLLPDTQVLEFSSRVMVRAQARRRAEETHQQAIAAERAHREDLGQERRRFASVLVPLVLAGVWIWIFLLVLGNVRERRAEIGILRALGVGESKIVAVFLLKALLMGLPGALAGYAAGVLLGAAWGGIPLGSRESLALFHPPLFAASLLVALALCAGAGWWPAMRAAREDPAVVLREG